MIEDFQYHIIHQFKILLISRFKLLDSIILGTKVVIQCYN